MFLNMALQCKQMLKLSQKCYATVYGKGNFLQDSKSEKKLSETT